MERLGDGNFFSDLSGFLDRHNKKRQLSNRHHLAYGTIISSIKESFAILSNAEFDATPQKIKIYLIQ